nr:MAG TPA: deoxyuridine 5'-triphosphate nucleotidohydrolase [Caudoviricetes sp.]
MKIKRDPGAYMPERAHSTDAGLDLRTPIDFSIEPRCSAAVDTGVHIQLPPGKVGMLKSKKRFTATANTPCFLPPGRKSLSWGYCRDFMLSWSGWNNGFGSTGK